MKKSILYIASLLVAAVGFTSCDDDKAMPPMPIPGADLDIPATNTTILELKEEFNDASTFSYNRLIGEKPDGSHYVICGKIVSSDEAGNIYKNLMIEDATAGLTIAVDMTKLYKTYKVGQMLTIDCTGLYIGGYGNCMQLGGEPQPGKDQPGRCDEEIFTAQAFVHGIPEPAAPQVITISELDAARADNDLFLAMQSRLVKLENMEFEEPGELIAEQGQSTSRYAVDSEGQRIQLYNSGYSTFWMNALPSGKGSITAILSYYNREWQLLLISLESLQGFSGSTAPVETIFSEGFNNTLGQFTADNINLPAGLTYVWKGSSYGATASAFNGSSYESDSRLVSPEIDLTGYTSAYASFEMAANKFASLETARQMCQFEVMNADGTWTAVEIPNFTDYASWTFRSSGQIDISAFAGKVVKIGFHYTSTASEAGTWEIKNLKVKGSK